MLDAKDVLDALVAEISGADEERMDREDDDVDRTLDVFVKVDEAWLDDYEEIGVWDCGDEALRLGWSAVKCVCGRVVDCKVGSGVVSEPIAI